MTMGAKKKAAWALAVLGFGAAYFFAVVCAVERPPNEKIFYLWPALGSMLSVHSFLRLRAYYRLEPPPPPWAFRLQLSDLIVLSFQFAALMSVLKAVVPGDDFPVIGPLLAFGVLALCAGGLLAASLRALFSGVPRYAYAFFHALRTYGWMTLGALIALIIFFVLAKGPSRGAEFFVKLVEDIGFSREEDFLFWYLRAGILAWIVGTVFLRWFEKNISTITRSS